VHILGEGGGGKKKILERGEGGQKLMGHVLKYFH